MSIAHNSTADFKEKCPKINIYNEIYSRLKMVCLYFFLQSRRIQEKEFKIFNRLTVSGLLLFCGKLLVAVLASVRFGSRMDCLDVFVQAPLLSELLVTKLALFWLHVPVEPQVSGVRLLLEGQSTNGTFGHLGTDSEVRGHVSHQRLVILKCHCYIVIGLRICKFRD